MQPGKFIERVLFLLALSSISSLALITIFIFLEGGPLIYFAGLKNFLASSHWAPTKGHFGILAMIVSSLLVTLGAMVIGMPLGLSCAIVLAEFSPTRLKLVLKPTLELLAGIPSVVYGFLGVVWLVPLIRDYLGGPGLSLLAAAIILGIMILPTIISISIDALERGAGPLPGGLHRLGGHPMANGAPGSAARGLFGHHDRHHPGHGPGGGRNHGGDHGGGQCPEAARTPSWTRCAPSPVTSPWSWATPPAATGRPCSPPALFYL